MPGRSKEKTIINKENINKEKIMNLWLRGMRKRRKGERGSGQVWCGMGGRWTGEWAEEMGRKGSIGKEGRECMAGLGWGGKGRAR